MAARRKQDAIKWCVGALTQHERLSRSYDAWSDDHTRSTRKPGGWDLAARQRSGAGSDAYMVDAHLFIVAVHQLCVTLREIDEGELLALLPDQEITHLRNAIEHDDDRGLYRRDYVGYGWTIGGSEQSGPSNLFGLDVEPVVVGLRKIAARLGPTTVLE